MEREKLYYTLFEQQQEFRKEQEVVPRELTETALSLVRHQLPIIITGVRRSGKSTLLKIISKELKLSNNEYLYINFNDERLIQFSIDDFQKILDFLQEQKYSENCYLFIDEIQEADHWEKWIDRIKDKHHIFITGSNSKLLSKEISTALTGRSISLSLYPFSFREFLKALNVNSENFLLDTKVQSKLREKTSVYLKLGGIPKSVVEEDIRLLSEIYENILYRDIIKRFNKNLEKPVKEVSAYLLTSISKEISLRSISQIIGIKNLTTISSILNGLESSFLFSFVPRFDFSVRKQIQNPKKVYCIDTGFITQIGFGFSDDKGKFLENAVFIELKRKNKEIYYYSGSKECDFLARAGRKITEAIQVCYYLNEDNKGREVGGLLEAIKKLKIPKGTIITFDQKDKLGDIEVIPFWEWLMRKE